MNLNKKINNTGERQRKENKMEKTFEYIVTVRQDDAKKLLKFLDLIDGVVEYDRIREKASPVQQPIDGKNNKV